MNWFNWNKNNTSPSEKKNTAGELEAVLLQALNGGGNKKNKKTSPVGTSYESMSKQGYMNAVAVYYCISLISQKAATVPIQLFRKAEKKEDRTEIYSHPILDLLRNPNPLMDRESYIESFLSYFLLGGNTYEKPIKGISDIKELLLYEPNEVELIESADLDSPELIQAAVPHNVVNGPGDRWALSLMLKDSKSTNQIAFNDALARLSDVWNTG